MVATEYERCISERERDSQQTLGDDASSQHSDNNIFLDVVQGASKKGRIYGLGTEGGKYRPSTSSKSSSGGISQVEELMRDLVTNLTVENKNLKIRLESHEELIHSSWEDNRLMQEQMCQFMERFAQGRSIALPLHPPSFIDQNNQQNEGDGSDDGFE